MSVKPLPDGGDTLEGLRKAMAFAEVQVQGIADRTPDYFPMYTQNGKWRHAGELWTQWCDGFLPGMMWIFHDRTRDPAWRRKAEHYSRLLEERKDDRGVHDLGFIFFHGTYQRWYRATVTEGRPNEDVRQVVIHAGRTLALRFKEKGQYLRSFVSDDSLFIDIMMNVPIIFYAAIQTDDPELMRIAHEHTETSRRVLVRGDGSTAHEAIFDLESGECLRQSTHQGFRGDSCWSRGLAWALYGFATCYKLAGNLADLRTSQMCADFYLRHSPADDIPPWDYDAPLPSRNQVDSSAGAIAAAGLFELADVTPDAIHRNHYRQTALRILSTLSGPAYLGTAPEGWEGILKHGVYHYHKNLGVDESVMWGEYFFVDALDRALTWLDA